MKTVTAYIQGRLIYRVGLYGKNMVNKQKILIKFHMTTYKLPFQKLHKQP